ncbi:Glycosyl hydrolase, five-bladed beta-propellor domain [Phytophthora cactorum]|nr:Glycosyl hydrolase, five-bladed beta-propellor domain [Phytophthora cactorum]
MTIRDAQWVSFNDSLCWFFDCLPLVAATAIGGYAAPGPCSGICTNAHDPSINRRSDGTYFRFSTGNKISVHTAPDITGPWQYKGSAIPNGSTINLKGKDDLWAPDVQKLGDWYYLYYSVSSFGSQNSAIGVARLRSMDVGTWEDGGAVITSDPSKPFNAIDPNLIHVGNEIYLNFGSSWQDIYQVHLRNPPVLPSVDPYQIGFTSDREVVLSMSTACEYTLSSHSWYALRLNTSPTY